MDEMMKAFLHGARRGSPTADWVEWVHRSRGKTHCETCLKLDKCWFMNANKPELPQHPFCHCETMPIPYSRVLDEANAQSAYSKYDPYLFDTMDYYKHGKNKVFESWGYSVDDSAWLKKEIEKQALRKYVAGEYSLGKLNKDGQRISIRVEIPRKTRVGMCHLLQDGWSTQTEEFNYQHHTEVNKHEDDGPGRGYCRKKVLCRRWCTQRHARLDLFRAAY